MQLELNEPRCCLPVDDLIEVHKLSIVIVFIEFLTLWEILSSIMLVLAGTIQAQ